MSSDMEVKHYRCIALPPLPHPITLPPYEPIKLEPGQVAGHKFDDRNPPLNLTALEIEADINAGCPSVYQVSTLMTFTNKEKKVLEGSLELQMPEGAVVCGYAVDIDGQMVEGCVVSKKKARVAFEKAVREKKDAPAMVEKVAGNIYRTRVYPMPSQGTRQVRLSYQAPAIVDKDGNAYYPVPANYGGDLTKAKCTVRVHAGNPEGKFASVPLLVAAPGIDREKDPKNMPEIDISEGDDTVRDFIFEAENVSGPGSASVVITLPKALAAPSIGVSRHSYSEEKMLGPEEKGVSTELTHDSVYLSAVVLPHVHADKSGQDQEGKSSDTSKGPLSIGVLWDSSLSRSPSISDKNEEARTNELRVLQALLTHWAVTEGRDVTVHLTPFREAAGLTSTSSFKAGKDAGEQISEMVSTMDEKLYDGASNLGALQLTSPYAMRVAQDSPLDDEEGDLKKQSNKKCQLTANVSSKVDFFLLFTDGLANIGKDEPPKMNVPVYVFDGGSHKEGTNARLSNSTLLEFIGTRSGGGVMPALSSVTGDTLQDLGKAWTKLVGVPQFQLIGATFSDKSLQDTAVVHPNSYNLGNQADARLVFTARAPASAFASDGCVESGTLTLTFGTGGVVTHTVKLQYDFSAVLKQKGSDGFGAVAARLWAQHRIASLSAFPEKNKKEIAKLGQQHGIVSAKSSFIVLKDLDQHVKNGIVPSRSRKKLFAQWQKTAAKKKKSAAEAYKKKVETVLGWWKASLKNMNRDVPKDTIRKNFENSKYAQLKRQLRDANVPPKKKDKEMKVKSKKKMMMMEGASLERRIREECDESSDCDEEMDVERCVSASAELVMDEMSAPALQLSAMVQQPSSSPGAPVLLSRMAAPAPAPRRNMRSRRRVRGGGAPEIHASASLAFGGGGGGGGGGGSDGSAPASEASVSIKKWDPATPYIKALKDVMVGVETADDVASALEAAYYLYLASRDSEYRLQPSYYFDVASWLLVRAADFETKSKELRAAAAKKDGDSEKKTDSVSCLEADKYHELAQRARDFGIRVICTVVELGLDDAQLLRIVGYKLHEYNYLDLARSVFERVLSIRPEEPQSYRDLGLVCRDQADYSKACELLNKVVLGKWDSRFNQIEVTALYELNAMLNFPEAAKARDALEKKSSTPIPDPKLRADIRFDLRFSLAWDTDKTDIDLHVYDPLDEHAYYSNKLTSSGGTMSIDFTQGYGPEWFQVKQGVEGKYKVQAKYFASHQQSLAGGTTLLLGIYRFFGDPKRQRKEIVSLRLNTNKSIIDVADIDFKGGVCARPWEVVRAEICAQNKWSKDEKGNELK